MRTYVSSQSGKRSLRTMGGVYGDASGDVRGDSPADMAADLKIGITHRTREVSRRVLEPALKTAEVADPAGWAIALAQTFGGATDSGTAKQVVVLGDADAAVLAAAAKRAEEAGLTPGTAVTVKRKKGESDDHGGTLVIDKRLKAAVDATKLHAGLDGALFGRMATSDLIARSDAVVKVGDAITCTPHIATGDTFVAVDDHASTPGAGHLNTRPFLGAATYYRPTVVDVRALAAAFPWLSPNEVGQLCAWVLRQLHRVGLAQRASGAVSPQSPVTILADVTRRQPLTAMLAFERPVQNAEEARQALAAELDRMDADSGAPTVRLAIEHYRSTGRAAIDALSDALSEAVTGALSDDPQGAQDAA